MTKPKLVLGLSGGVDSAVAATVLSQDYDVTCVFLHIGKESVGGDDAAALAHRMGLPFQSVDISEELETHVCRYFADSYRQGTTPLPCAKCNPQVKFPGLLRVADAIGAPYIATGHYARITRENGGVQLRKGHPSNDQSYMLAQLPLSILERFVTPLGGLPKSEVRKLAGLEDLFVADKPDSMEICFIPDNDYAAWLERRGAMPPVGNFVDPEGKILGQHLGIHHYTLGQGRGLGLSGPHRYFVSKIDPVTNEVTLSDGSDLMANAVTCSGLNWLYDTPLTAPMEVAVRLRHAKTHQEATIAPLGGGRVDIQLHTPARAPTPGQLAVFYEGDRVLGSGWIERR